VADIPLSRVQITGRRSAEDAVGREYGGRGAAPHSPSRERPGPIGELIRSECEEAGFPLATTVCDPSRTALVETYPHPVLIHLMRADYRVQYKVTKTKTYWPKLGLEQRMENVARILEDIRISLSAHISKIPLIVPDQPTGLSNLKPVEDMIDALLCAWVGILILGGKARAFGDENASIWLPAE
jgi:predicted RNase H-like nuclease